MLVPYGAYASAPISFTAVDLLAELTPYSTAALPRSLPRLRLQLLLANRLTLAPRQQQRPRQRLTASALDWTAQTRWAVGNGSQPARPRQPPARIKPLQAQPQVTRPTTVKRLLVGLPASPRASYRQRLNA